MKISIKKAFAALVAVTTMAVGMGSMNASAGSWAVRDIKGAPGSVNVHEYVDVKNANGTVSSTRETCTIANYCISDGGQTSRARYHGYYEYTGGGTTYKKTTFSSKYHTISTGSQTISFVNTVPDGCNYYVKYYLEYYTPGNCEYAGTIG